MAEKFEKLFDQFAPVTPEEWRAKAEVDLKGADYSKKMIWRTNEGFNVEPIYRGVDIENLRTSTLPMLRPPMPRLLKFLTKASPTCASSCLTARVWMLPHYSRGLT